MSNSHERLETILRGMIREEIDRTSGFRELTGRSTLPANVDAEKVILGAVLLDNGAMEEAKEISAEDFSLDSHRRIWLAMVALLDAGRPVDLITLREQLGEGTKEVGGVAYLASLTEDLPRRPVISEYIKIVQEKARLRRIMSACLEAIKSCQEQKGPSGEIVKTLGIALKGIRKEAK